MFTSGRRLWLWDDDDDWFWMFEDAAAAPGAANEWIIRARRRGRR